MSNPSRRAVMLTGAAASLTAGTLAAEADQAASFSPEYWECHRRGIDLERLLLLPDRDYETVTAEEAAAATEVRDRYRQSTEALLRRPVRNLYDVVALMRLDFWYMGHFVRVDEWAEDSEHVKAMAAVTALVGTWHVPYDLIRGEAEERARREAAEAARARRPRPDRVCYI